MSFSDLLLRQRLLAQGVNPYSGAGGPSTPGVAAANPGLYQRLLAGAFPANDASGLTTPEQQRAAQQQGLLAFGSNLLANSGSQPGPRQGFGSLVGQALQAGQGASQGSINGQLQQLLLKSKLDENKRQAAAGGQDPALVAEYKFAQANGFTGGFQEYIKSKQTSPGAPADIQSYEYYDKLPPEQKKSFLEIKRNSQPFQLNDYAGGKALLNRVTGEITPQTSAAQEAAGAGQLASAKAEGGVTGEAAGGIQKKAIGGKSVLDQLALAEPLIDISTGSVPGKAVDSVVGFFGGATDGAKANAQLKVIQAGLIGSMPRLEGPQSDADRKLYIESAGQIGDATVPAEIKKAAIQTIRRIQEQYGEAAAAQRPSGGASGNFGAPAAAKAARPPISSFRRP